MATDPRKNRVRRKRNRERYRIRRRTARLKFKAELKDTFQRIYDAPLQPERTMITLTHWNLLRGWNMACKIEEGGEHYRQLLYLLLKRAETLQEYTSQQLEEAEDALFEEE